MGYLSLCLFLTLFLPVRLAFLTVFSPSRKMTTQAYSPLSLFTIKTCPCLAHILWLFSPVSSKAATYGAGLGAADKCAEEAGEGNFLLGEDPRQGKGGTQRTF